MARLQIDLPDGRQMGCELADHPVVIGRSAACEITLDEPAASRRHACIRPVGDDYQLEDLGSLHGTRLNGREVNSALLRHGDVIVIGNVRAVFAQAGRRVPPAPVVIAGDDQAGDFRTLVGAPAELSIPLQRLRMLYDLSARLTSVRDADALVSDALDICFETLRFERGAVALIEPVTHAVNWRATRGIGDQLVVSQSVLNRALEQGERSILTEDSMVDRSASIEQLGIRSALCVPIMIDQEILGAIYGDRLSSAAVYSDQDVDFLFGIAQQVAIGLANCRLAEEKERKIKLETQLALARRTQQLLFPAELPTGDRVRVAAFNDPGLHVSGDYYDVIHLEGRLLFTIADVTGKGVAASLLVANLQGVIRATAKHLADPARSMADWNQVICGNTDGGQFITCLLGLLDVTTRHLQLVTAGHSPPYVVQTDGSHTVPEVIPGLPLGVDLDASYESIDVELPPGPCTIFAYTDGVNEAMSPQREEFDLDRLSQALKKGADLQPNDLLVTVAQAIGAHTAGAPQHDDITMLAIQVV